MFQIQSRIFAVELNLTNRAWLWHRFQVDTPPGRFHIAARTMAPDPTIQFAIEGKQHSMQRIQMTKRIRFFLDTPGILENERQLENAVRLLQQLKAMASKGPQLSAQTDQLEQRITDAQTPIKVIIESDSLTDVAVYRVAKLGRFATRELDLKPGTYTVVGARDGYQDVRRKIVIKAGQKPMRLIVKCTVKI